MDSTFSDEKLYRARRATRPRAPIARLPAVIIGAPASLVEEGAAELEAESESDPLSESELELEPEPLSESESELEPLPEPVETADVPVLVIVTMEDAEPETLVL